MDESGALQSLISELHLYPTPENAEAAGKAIAMADLSYEAKRDLFKQIYLDAIYSDVVEGILTLWTLAIRMNQPDENPVPVIEVLRNLLEITEIDPAFINRWIIYVYTEQVTQNRELKSFLARDLAHWSGLDSKLLATLQFFY
jgi:hypothetical protein